MFDLVPAALRADQHLLDARLAAEDVGHSPGEPRIAVGTKNVGELVIDHCEGLALFQVKMLAVIGLPHGQQAGLAAGCGSDNRRDRPA